MGGQIFQMGLVNDQVSRIIRKAVTDPFQNKLFPENIASAVVLEAITDRDMPAVGLTKHSRVVRGIFAAMAIRKGGSVSIPLSLQIFTYLTIPLTLSFLYHRPGGAFFIFPS